MDTLKELYIDQLQDVYSANEQAGKVFEKLKAAAANEDLADVIEKSIKHTKGRNERLAKLIEGHDAKPSGEHCKGMEGIVKEAKKHAIEENFTNQAVQDAQIIAQYQRISHYGIAGYGTCKAFAQQLGLNEEATILGKDLEDLFDGDGVMSSLAEGQINRKAAA